MENSKLGVHLGDPHRHRHTHVAKQLLQLMGSEVGGPLLLLASSSFTSFLFSVFVINHMLSILCLASPSQFSNANNIQSPNRLS